MKYIEIKNKKQEDTNKLFETLGVFWAFSNKQFEEGYAKAKLSMAEGEKLVDIGAGGYMPKHNVEALKNGMKEIEKTFKASIKEAKAREEHILYELNNHEAYYTGTTEDTKEALGEDYTNEEIQTVFNANRKQYLMQDEEGTIHNISDREAEYITNNKQDEY